MAKITKNNLDYPQSEQIRQACINAAREGFIDASMSGLCTEGAMEAAISAIQSLDLEVLIKNLNQTK